MDFLKAQFGQAAREPYKPKPRFCHYAAAIEGQSVVFAGKTTDMISKIELSTTIEVLDHYQEKWRKLTATGDLPKGLYAGGCCISPDGDLYIYGGHDGISRRGALHKLTPGSMVWARLSEEGVQGSNDPSHKTGCQMIFFGKDKLALVGGYGLPLNPTQPGGTTFVKDSKRTDGSGCSNEIHIFDLNQCLWSSPSMTGQRPPPCFAFTLTSINDYQAVFFGGKGEQFSRVDHLYIFDFQSMVITLINRQDEDLWPVGRSAHAACCLGYGSKHPCLLIVGGVDKDDQTLKDAWLFEVRTRRWTEIPLPDWMLPRWSHSIVAVELAPGLTEVSIFGGSTLYEPGKPLQEHHMIAETVIMTFDSKINQKLTSEWKLVSIANESQLEDYDRIRKKHKKIKQYAREAARAVDVSIYYERDISTLREVVSDLQERERELQQKVQDLHTKLQEANRKAEEAAKEVPPQEIQLSNWTDKELQHQVQLRERTKLEREQFKIQATSVEERVDLLREQLQQEQSRHREREEYLEMRARDAEAQLLDSQTEWIVSRNEIEITRDDLGKGAWGSVSVAKFRGTLVAAKCYHQVLMSQHNLRHFSREIVMAARLRHPNLVQFIGASTEGELILVTELMTISLGTLMHRGPLSKAHITTISLDVARALNYLHLMQPRPMIHRDISSGNVLLDLIAENCWKAKVSDYGSVNLLQHLTTVYPGNPFYAAPESKDPDLQTPKMDIYSFGVLLAEMLTDELPEREERQRQMLKISIEHPDLSELVRRCLSVQRDHCPSANEIIIQLNELNFL